MAGRSLEAAGTAAIDHPRHAAGSRARVAKLAAQNARFADGGGDAAEIVRWVARRHAPKAVLACSFGLEDCVLVDLISRHAATVRAFYLDTQLLFPETYATRDRLRERYGIDFVRVLPALDVEQQADSHGPALWRRDPDCCCQLRKVQPLRAHLAEQDAWITGVRREQSPSRANAPFVEWDERFGLVKANPLAAWTAHDVASYIEEHNVPHNPMHAEGYPSIGCWPCTRAVRAGEDPRAGRWSGRAKTECGLHG